MFLREFLTRYNNHEFVQSDRSTQIKAGWTDWFCKDTELARRLYLCCEILTKIKTDFILDNFQVKFFNHCPIDYPLYDEIRFNCPNLDDNYEFAIHLHHPVSPGNYDILTFRNNWDDECSFDSVQDVINWIANWEKEAKNPPFYRTKAEQEAELRKACEEAAAVLHDVQSLLDN